jgi:hypothetical protein
MGEWMAYVASVGGFGGGDGGVVDPVNGQGNGHGDNGFGKE